MKKMIKPTTKINCIMRGSSRGFSYGDDQSLKYKELRKAIKDEEYCEELYKDKDVDVYTLFNDDEEKKKCISKIENNEIYVGLDVFGEGVVAVGAKSKKDLKVALLDFMHSINFL